MPFWLKGGDLAGTDELETCFRGLVGSGFVSNKLSFGNII